MRVLRLLLLSAALSTALVTAQEETSNTENDSDAPRPVPPVITSMQVPVKVHRSRMLPDGTPVTLRLLTAVKSNEARVGDVVDSALDHDLYQGDLLLAREGSATQAVVVEASKAKWGSRRGKLAIEIRGVRMVNGQTLPLRGTPRYGGSVGPAAQVGGTMVSDAAAGPDACPVCEIVLVPATIVTLIAPGTNVTIKANTLAITWVDGDVILDPRPFLPLENSPGRYEALVRIVRGAYGALYSRDFYCNGVPMARIPGKHRLELELEPGWYRFAMNPKKEPLQLYLAAGSEMRLITDYDRVYIVNESGKAGNKLADSKTSFGPDRSLNTFSPFSKHKTEMQFLESAKPVDAADIYPTECHPLAEEDRDNVWRW